jgi:DNA-directed RNA polymerase specialized sigma subunit
MTNKEKIEKLKEYTHLCKELDILMESYMNLRMKLMSPKIPELKHDRIQCTLTDITTENLAEMCDLENSINQRRTEIINARLVIERAIENVEKAELRKILYVRYVKGEKWEKIANEMNYNWRTVHKLHSRALSQIIF